MAAAQFPGFTSADLPLPICRTPLALETPVRLRKSSSLQNNHFCPANFVVKRIRDNNLRSMNHPNFEVREVHVYAPGMCYEGTTIVPGTLHDCAPFRTKGPVLRAECALLSENRHATPRGCGWRWGVPQKPAQPAAKLHPKLMPQFTASCVRNSMLRGFLLPFQRVKWGSDPDGSLHLNSAGFGKTRLHMARLADLAFCGYHDVHRLKKRASRCGSV